MRNVVMTCLIVVFTTHLQAAVQSDKKTKKVDCEQSSQYTFSWSLSDHCNMKPRGGTSKGAKVNLIDGVSKQWKSLQDTDISNFERDRRAILAMAGAYRVSFDFLETVGFVEGYKPSQPYQSWGTEYVYVAEDDGDYISLQHIMVMTFVDKDGKESEPMVMKHWRQDWQYQKRKQLVYAGHNKWKSRKLSRKKARGTWSQSVYQVDDAPRYEAHGKWVHKPNFSTWTSRTTWRPLPRREGSKRSDYHVLEGVNKHTITPQGWVQEEENLKLVLDEQGKPAANVPYLAKELGVARYDRIAGYNFAPGDEYWRKTADYWADVREVWQDYIDENDTLVISKKQGKNYRFMQLFAQAQKIAEQGSYKKGSAKAEIREILAHYVSSK